jgi:hypothetical protein
LNEEKQKQEMADGQKTEFNLSNISQSQKETVSKDEIKARIEQRITRSMSNKLKEKQATQAIAVINNLIIPSSEKLKLKTIAKKLYQSIKLTQEEAAFWNSFSNIEKCYILTGNTAQSLDFIDYQKPGYCVETQPQVDIHEEQEQEPHLFFVPSSSDSDSSEDPDYIPPVPLRRIITMSDDSWPDNSNSRSIDQPST